MKDIRFVLLAVTAGLLLAGGCSAPSRSNPKLSAAESRESSAPSSTSYSAGSRSEWIEGVRSKGSPKSMPEVARSVRFGLRAPDRVADRAYTDVLLHDARISVGGSRIATLPPEQRWVTVVYGGDLVLSENPDRGLATKFYLDSFDLDQGAKSYVKHLKVGEDPAVGWDLGLTKYVRDDGSEGVIEDDVSQLIWIHEGVLYGLSSDTITKVKDLVPIAETVMQSSPR